MPFVVESLAPYEQRISFRAADSWCRANMLALSGGVQLAVTACRFEPSFAFAAEQPPAELELVVSRGARLVARTDEGQIRAAAVTYGVPCVTTLPGCVAMVRALEHRAADPSPRVRALQEWGERRVESRGSRVES